MRLLLIRNLLFVAILTLPTATLTAQVLTISAPLPLPDLPGQRLHALAALPNVGFVMASNQPTSHRTAEVYYAVTGLNGEQILNTWDIHHHIPTSLRLVPTATGFFSTFLDLADLNLPNRLLANWFDPQEGDTPSFFLINPEGTYPTAYDVTQLADGNLLTVWTDINPNADTTGPAGLFAQILAEGGEPVGGRLHIADGVFVHPNVAADAAGGFLVTWQDTQTGEVNAKAFDQSGTGGPTHRVVGAAEAAAQLSLAALPNGNFMLVWAEVDPMDPSMIFARRLSPRGQPFLEKVSVSTPSDHSKTDPKVTTDRFGRSWVVWTEDPISVPKQTHVRVLNPGNTTGGMLQIPATTEFDQQGPLVAVNQEGDALVAWKESFLVQARTIKTSPMCTDSDTVLCLHEGRFQVEVTWMDSEGQNGSGHALPFQSSDSGLFWFFEEKIWEVMVKVIDACAFNGFYWVYSAATTDVAYQLEVTDTATGLHWSFFNELGQASPAVTDSTALMSCPLGPP